MLIVRKLSTHAKSKSELTFTPTLEGVGNELCFSESGSGGNVNGEVMSEGEPLKSDS